MLASQSQQEDNTRGRRLSAGLSSGFAEIAMKEEITGTESNFGAEANGVHTPASRVRYQVLGAASVLALITYIQRLGLLRDSGPELKKSLGLDDSQMGNIAAAFLVAYGLCQVPGGWLADR